MSKMKTGRFFLGVLGWLVTFFVFFQIVLDPDLGLQIGVGKYVLENGRPPETDLFSFTMPDYRYVYHAWLSQTLYYLAYRGGGLIGVTAFFACLGTAAMVIMVAIGRKLGARCSPILFTPWAAGLVFYAAYLRVQLFSLIGVGLVFYTYLVSVKSRKNYFWWWPVLFAFWANLHGGFMLGLGFALSLIGVDLLVILNKHFFKLRLIGKIQPGMNFRRWLVMVFVFAVSVSACLFNPYGGRVYEQVLRMGTSQYVHRFNIDWSPLVATYKPSSGLFCLVLVAMVGGLLLVKSSLSWQIKALSTVFLALTIIMNRYSLVLLMVLLPSFWVWTEMIFRQLRLDQKSKKMLGLMGGLLVVGLVGEQMLNARQLVRSVRSESFYIGMLEIYGQPYSYPLGAVNYLQVNENPKRILNDFNWGGYLVWKLPDRPVFIHGFMDHYYLDDQSFAHRYFEAIKSLDVLEEAVAEFGVDGVLISPEWPLGEALRLDDRWEVLFEDETAVLYGRVI